MYDLGRNVMHSEGVTIMSASRLLVDSDSDALVLICIEVSWGLDWIIINSS